MPHVGAVTVAILAGGAGSRFGGRDKGLIELGGKPLVAWVASACPTDSPIVVIANRNVDAYARYGRVLSDDVAGHPGPLTGIRVALQAASTELVATLPVDCPRPPTHWLARLKQALGAQTSVAVAHDGIDRQPLFALYRRACVDTAPSVDASVWRWQNALGAIDVDFSDCAAAFANINTEAERLRYEQRIADESA